MPTKRVMVSGCFDLLHAGHIAFLREASTHGELHVAVGTDENLARLKGKPPMFSLAERVYILRALECVTDAFPSTGRGLLDFEADIPHVKPDIFVVNEDGDDVSKRTLCERLGIEYCVLSRIPADGLPARSSSATKRELASTSVQQFPYRLALVGGWIDQPWVSQIQAGSMVVVQLEPSITFNDRSGMATSTRKTALKLWPDRIPDLPPDQLAKLMFGAENPPGTEYVSGSQDALGLMLPGINRLHYDGGYWPSKVDSITDRDTCDWLESVLHLVPLSPRPDGYDPLTERHVDPQAIKKLGATGQMCMDAIRARNTTQLGTALNDTRSAWQAILPETIPSQIDDIISNYTHHAGCLPSGCGGGYLVVASELPISGAISIRIRSAVE